jgi:hypothetical protein
MTPDSFKANPPKNYGPEQIASLGQKIESFNAATPFRPYLIWPTGGGVIEIQAPDEVKVMHAQNGLPLFIILNRADKPVAALMFCQISLIQYEMTKSEMINGCLRILAHIVKHPLLAFKQLGGQKSSQ